MHRAIRAVVLLLLVAPLASLFGSRAAHTLPLYAARTGYMCQQCHFDPNGGGPRNDFGFMFARNRHSTDADTTGAWKDLNLTNRIGDTMPVYFGVNQRFMLLTGTSTHSDSLDRFAFFGMENSLHITFQPHEKLTLVYSRDAFAIDASNASVEQKEAFGILHFNDTHYVKIGRFRNPFGLRMDDHTVATRNGFLDLSSGQGFLPYDPRYPDMGVEVGGARGPFFGRVAFTNGHANFSNGFAETKAIKLGYNSSFYQGGVSFYDEYQKVPVTNLKRSTRWGYYALGHHGPVALVGEIAAGTDEALPVLPGAVTGAKTNLLAGFAELDWAAGRSVNFRARYDYLNPDRSSIQVIRDLNSHQRYALESEWVPVPFAELRFAVRRIQHQDEAAFGFKDETQFFTQAHFSY